MVSRILRTAYDLGMATIQGGPSGPGREREVCELLGMDSIAELA